ncbi:DDE-type integrase/transposase/recombinase [Nonomuraea sp. NPDC005983]|uniref:DDE-type integrase/transposase/recombinase n=1 Tax=Nonomuraea sp. NPDC005983 TaxID=3155595 RepID=UPI0033B5574C
MHRHRHPRPPVHGPRRPFRHPAELSEDEREQVLAVLDSPRFADKSPGQAWAILLDEGVYLCSQATMYRLLRERGQSGERRAQAVRPPTSRPELEADGPNQVWSWDITKLKGPMRGVYYLLYVIIDIFSRKVVHWEIWPTENGTLATEFLQNAIAANGGIAPCSIHADRGASMTSNTVTGLLALLGIDQSHSRPHVSNDNPYSEAHFKTLKYCPAFPGRSGPKKTPTYSVFNSSAITITSTAIPGSRCTRPPRCMTAPPSRSRPSGSPPSTRPSRHIPSGSADGGPTHRLCRPRCGSISHSHHHRPTLHHKPPK